MPRVGHGAQPAQGNFSFLLLQVWQCGERIEVLPCSRVAHLERHHKPYALDLAPALKRNALRVAEIWMDEYKDMVYLAWNIPLQVRHGIDQGWTSTKEDFAVVVVGNRKGESKDAIPTLRNKGEVSRV